MTENASGVAPYESSLGGQSATFSRYLVSVTDAPHRWQSMPTHWPQLQHTCMRRQTDTNSWYTRPGPNRTRVAPSASSLPRARQLNSASRQNATMAASVSQRLSWCMTPRPSHLTHLLADCSTGGCRARGCRDRRTLRGWVSR